MESCVTAKIKIPATEEILATLKVYKEALQFCIDTSWEKKIRNNVELHPFVYPKLRETLPAQLAIACIKQACGMVKKAKSKPTIRHVSIRYNFPRSASFKNNILSILTIKGRVKVRFSVPDCYREYFSWERAESLLHLDRKGKCFFLFIFSKEINTESPLQKRVLGVDLGINNLAACSDGTIFKSPKTKLIQFSYMRSKLQAKGTKSAKRLLRKLSGRQRRFMAWVNHNVSKQIVANADTIVLEDLKGIRKSRNRFMGKRLNRWLNGWAFRQLQRFIAYKAGILRKRVKFVSPYLTSQTCSYCGKIGSRHGDSFVCSCGFSAHADLNASFNLRRLPVTQPYNPCDDSIVNRLVEHRVKVPRD